MRHPQSATPTAPAKRPRVHCNRAEPMRIRLRDERRDRVMGSAETYDWNDNAIGELHSLWAEGHSTAEIGRRLGVSKNAVVGKAHRLNLPARPSPVRRSNATGPGGAPSSAPKRMPVPKLTEMAPIQVCAHAHTPRIAAKPDPPSHHQPLSPPPSILTARSAKTCCWPIGHPGTPAFRFCEQPAQAGKPYCGEHNLIAYQPRARRESPAPSERCPSPGEPQRRA